MWERNAEERDERLHKFMPVTRLDLDQFKLELVYEVRQLLLEAHGAPRKRWLKSFEVRELLGVGHGTLHRMRTNGQLPYTPIGGVFYYDVEDVQRMIEKYKRNPYREKKKN